MVEKCTDLYCACTKDRVAHRYKGKYHPEHTRNHPGKSLLQRQCHCTTGKTSEEVMGTDFKTLGQLETVIHMETVTTGNSYNKHRLAR